jgi:hypothetical protein
VGLLQATAAAGSRNPSTAAPSDLSLSYTAKVDLNIYRADRSTDHGMDVRDLPLAILPYLLPSRFVPSDKLAQFAMRVALVT